MLPSVQKSLQVPASIADAFRAWTEDIGRWWPLATHSVGQAQARSCTIEPRLGGRIYETTEDGAEHLWGTVTVWEPPRRLVHTWHPGQAATDYTLIEIQLSGTDDDGARLRLDHRGWDDQDGARRAQYEAGWQRLLDDCFLRHLGADD